MSLNSLQLAIKLTLDNRDIVGNIEISRQQLRALAADMRRSADAGTSAFSTTRTALKSISSQLAQARDALLGYFTVMETARGARAIVEAADAMRGLSARLRIATADAADYARAQAGVFEIANRYGAAVDETARAFARLNPVIRQMGGGSAETLKMLDGLSASLKLSGATAAETSSVLLQFAQAMGSGKVGGDELRSMMEQAEPLMRAVAQQMGKTTGELRMMAEQGQLTSSAFGNALLPAIDRLAGQAAKVPNGLSQSLQVLRNELSRAFGREFEQQATGLSTAIQGMAGHADTAARAVRVLTDALLELGKAAAAVFAGAAIGGFVAAVSRAGSAIAALRSALAGVNTVLIGIAAGAAIKKLEKLSAMGKGGLLGAVFFGAYEITDWLLNLTRLREKIDDALEPVFRAMDRMLGIDRGAGGAPGVSDKIGSPAGEPKRLADPAAFARLTQNLDYETKLVAKHKQELADLEQAYQDKLATIKDAAARRTFEKEYRQARQELLIKQRRELEGIGSRQEAQAIARARVEAAKATGEAEFAILKQGLERAKAAYDAALEDRLISIRGYYAAKTAIEQRQIDAEIARTQALLAEQKNAAARVSTEADRIRARGEVAKLESELIGLNDKRAAVEQANARAAARAERELADALEEARLKLAEITGTATDADRRAAVERSFRDLRARLAAEGDAGGVSIIDRLIDVEAAQRNLQALEDAWRRALETMRQAEQSIAIQQAQGLITTSEAQRRIAAAHQEASAALDELLPKMEAAAQAIGPDAVARVQAWKNELASVKTVIDPVVSTINTQVQDAFAGMFAAIGTGAKSAKEAFADFGRSVLATLNRIAANKLAESLLGMAFGPAGAGGAIKGLFGFARGGPVPGSGDRDTVPAVHSAGARIWFVAPHYIQPEYTVSQTAQVRLCPRTGRDELAVTAATTISRTIGQRFIRPYPPGKIELNGQSYPVTVAGDVTVNWANRNRVMQTAQVVLQTDDNVTPETGQTTTIRFYDSGNNLRRTYSGLTGTSQTWTLAQIASDGAAASNSLRIEIESSRTDSNGTFTSLYKHDITVQRAGYGLNYGNFYGGA